MTTVSVYKSQAADVRLKVVKKRHHGRSRRHSPVWRVYVRESFSPENLGLEKDEIEARDGEA